MRMLKSALKMTIQLIWLVKFRIETYFLPGFLRRSKRLVVFNLDLHVSVISDLSDQFARRTFRLVRWSISSHNFVFRKVFKIPDPVEFVNQNNWRNLNPISIGRFNNQYKGVLQEVDFFVVTHTPSFIQIFEKYRKPILCINSTRYEAPYTNNAELWTGLNNSIIRGSESGKLTMWSNNKVDQGYLSKIIGVQSELVPSLCAYVDCRWSPSDKTLIYVAKTDVERALLKEKLGEKWLSAEEGLGKNYKYEKLASVSAVFFLPYQLSTMSLFELATMGVPVIVPSAAFLKKLWNEGLPVLSEILYAPFEVFRDSLQSRGLEIDWLVNLDWWLDRADFYDAVLMPNVTTVDSFEEVANLQFPICNQEWRDRIDFRNTSLKQSRELHFNNFLSRAGISVDQK